MQAATWPVSATATVVILALLLVVGITAIMVLLNRTGQIAEAKLCEWRNRDLAMVRTTEHEAARREAALLLEEWRQSSELAIRQDALKRSGSVVLGKVSEHLLPFTTLFPYNPKDARFLGSPIDLIVFDGLDEDDLSSIVFVEVKTGDSRLTPRQRQIRQAIGEGRVVFRELRDGDVASASKGLTSHGSTQVDEVSEQMKALKESLRRSQEQRNQSHDAPP